MKIHQQALEAYHNYKHQINHQQNRCTEGQFFWQRKLVSTAFLE